jgi:hypothetical protein
MHRLRICFIMEPVQWIRVTLTTWTSRKLVGAATRRYRLPAETSFDLAVRQHEYADAYFPGRSAHAPYVVIPSVAKGRSAHHATTCSRKQHHTTITY